MKRKLLSLIAVALIGGTANAQCDLTLNETDSWGDGWNGSEISVTINGTPTTYTLGGGSAGLETITVNDGDVVSIDWLGGGPYDNEVGFDITDANGGVLASASDPGVQNYFTGVISCAGNCAWPTAVNAVNVGPDEADISWTMNGAETSWTIEYGPAPLTPGSGTTVVLGLGDVSIVGNIVTYNLTGLANLTDFDVIVQADCGASVLSHGLIGSFQTLSSCPEPGTFALGALDNDSSTVSWVAGWSETTWNVEWGTAGFTPGTGSATVNVVNPDAFDTIGGLTQLTGYEVYVQADCGVDSSAWVGPIGFTTLANCASLTGVTPTVISPDSIGVVWTPGTTGETEWIIDYGVTGFTAGTGTSVGVMTNPYDTLEPLTQNTTYDIYVRGVCSTQDSSSWVGPVTVTTPLYCNNPSALGATTNADTAFLAWTVGSDGETEWNVEYGPIGFTLGTGTMFTTTNNPDTITGLTGSSNYDYYVQASCASGDTSLFVGPFTFSTALDNDDACDAYELPVDGVTRSYFSTGATSQGETFNGFSGASTWFYFIYPSADGVNISLCGSGYDTKVSAYTSVGCSDFGTYSQIGYNDDFCGLQSEIEVCGNAGDTIRVMVDGYSGSTGDFDITLTGTILNAGTGASLDVCAGDTVNLWDHVSGQIDNSGMWVYPPNPNAVINDSLAQTGAMTLVGTDYYYIMSNACGADSATVTVNAMTMANSGTEVSPFEVCNWGNIYLYDGLSGTIDFGGTWNDNTGTGLLTGASLQVSMLNAGSYQFTYTASNGVCPDANTTITVDVMDCTGIEEEASNNFSVYPNPSTGVFTVEYAGNDSNVEMSILDLNGKVVYSQTINSNKTNIELNTIANGVYTIILVSNDTVSTTKMVVAK